MSEREPRADIGADAYDTVSVLDRMLAHPAQPPGTGVMSEMTVAAWAESTGTLTDGRTARAGVSCLLRPVAGDRVLVWSGADGSRWVLSVLDRPDRTPAAVLATTGPLTIEAPRIGFVAGAVHIQAEDFLTTTRNRHAVEQTRTETVHVRVAQVGTDIRRATNATDEISSTFLQRAGTWVSNTAREARLHARAFLFD